MTQYLESLKIGDTIDVRGPSGRIQYISPGTLSVKKSRKDPPVVIKVKKINLIAGGVGEDQLDLELYFFTEMITLLQVLPRFCN